MRGWLIKARKDKGMTQKQVADLIGFAKPTIGKYELGKRTPKPDIAKKIGEILGIDWTMFYE